MMDEFSLWQIAVAILVAGASYGALYALVRGTAAKLAELESATSEEFRQVWREMRACEDAHKISSEAIIVRLTKIEITLERLARWVDKQED